MALRFFAVSGLAVLASTAAIGGTSGLNVMPTTDTLGPGDFTSMISHSAATQNYEMGLRPGMELGYDITDGESRIWNMKLPVAYREGSTSVAVGVINIGKGVSSQTYLVGNTPVGAGRMHLGAITSEGTLRPMVGFDKQLNDRLIVMADYIAGAENCAGLGFSLALGEGAGITVSALRNNSGSRPYGFSITVNRTVSIGQILGIKTPK